MQQLERTKVKERKEKFEKEWEKFYESYGGGHDHELARYFYTLGYNDQFLKVLDLTSEIEDLKGDWYESFTQ